MPFNTPQQGPNGSTLRVDPDQVLQLKKDLQPIHDDVKAFLETKAPAMTIRPLGADRVSGETAMAFNENSQAAIDVAYGYLDELEGVLDALDQAVKTYNLVEDTNTKNLGRGAQ